MPAVLIFLIGLWNWKAALMIVAAVGIATAFALASQLSALDADVLPRRRRRGKNREGDKGKAPPVAIRVLLTPPVLVLLLFFLTTTLPTSGIQTFSPILFGWIIDLGAVRYLFWLFAAVMLATLGTLFMPRQKIT